MLDNVLNDAAHAVALQKLLLEADAMFNSVPPRKCRKDLLILGKISLELPSVPETSLIGDVIDDYLFPPSLCPIGRTPQEVLFFFFFFFLFGQPCFDFKAVLSCPAFLFGKKALASQYNASYGQRRLGIDKVEEGGGGGPCPIILTWST